MLSRPPHGAELQHSPGWDRCVPWGDSGQDSSGDSSSLCLPLGAQTGSESSKFSDRINLIMAHMGAPQRTVTEGNLLKSERVEKLIH